MNCAEFEQLIDAYLDGELAGSLRLEFDAHRLRCRRCQLAMAAMESVETVLANDRPRVMLSDDFTDRVMGAIERRRPASTRLRPTRIILVAGALLQAAAVLFLAIYPWRGPSGEPAAEATTAAVDATLIAPGAARDLDEVYSRADRRTELHQALVDQIFDRIEAAGVNVAMDLNHLVRYASALPIPDDLARASERMNEANFLNFFFEAAIAPGAFVEPASTSVGSEEHSL